MDDGIRISDADRDRIAGRLRDHFADGRLTAEELDERLTTTLTARTVGDLRGVLADLPEAAPAPLLTRQLPVQADRRRMVRHRGPRILPLAALALVAALVIPGAGWLLLAVLKIVLVSWLLIGLAGILILGRFRSRMRRGWHLQAGYSQHRRQDWPGGYARQWCGHWR